MNPDLVALQNGSATDGKAVALDQAETLVWRGLWVGGGGDLSLVCVSGNAITLTNVPSGTLLPISVRQVNTSGTTATGLVLLR
jgi:hypothetical protein